VLDDLLEMKENISMFFSQNLAGVFSIKEQVELKVLERCHKSSFGY
jgi:hypothetical protein